MGEAGFDPEKLTSEMRKAWSATASKYDRMSFEYFSAFVKTFIEFAVLQPGETVLDVACGSGLASFAAAEKVGLRGRVLGVDLAPGMVEVASQRARLQGVPQVEFLEMNAEQLTFQDNSFDAVICHLGLMLFARPDQALKEMVRVVKKNGRVACLVQGVPEKMIFTSLVQKTVLKHVPELKVPGAPTVYSFGPPGALERAFQEAGLERMSAIRLEGTFTFPSAQAYWETLTNTGGRMRSILQGLDPEVREVIRREALQVASTYQKGKRLEIPYEVVMAKGSKIK